MFRPIQGIRDEYVRAYSGLPRRAWILFAVNLVNSSGAMVIFFLSLYLTRKLGLGTGRAGRALSLYGMGSIAGAYVGGWLADRMGSIRVQKISLAVCGALLIALGQARSMAGIAPLLFGMALSSGMLYPANATSMSNVCPPGLQVKGFALNRLANNLGATIGPAVGGVLAVHDYRLLFWADGLTSLAAFAVFALLWRKSRAAAGPDGTAGTRHDPEEGEKAGEAENPKAETAAAGSSAETGLPVRRGQTAHDRPISPWRDTPFLLLMLIFLVFYGVFVQVLTTFPLYMRNVYGLAENRIGQLFAVNTVMIVAMEMILMEKIRKYPMARMINLSIILIGAGLGLMPFGRSFAFAALTVAVWTFGEMLSMPLVTALVAGRAGEANRGRYMGLFSFVFSLAFVVAPAAGTAIYERFGGDAVWGVCAAVCLLLAAAFSMLRPALER